MVQHKTRVACVALRIAPWAMLAASVSVGRHRSLSALTRQPSQLSPRPFLSRLPPRHFQRWVGSKDARHLFVPFEGGARRMVAMHDVT